MNLPDIYECRRYQNTANLSSIIINFHEMWGMSGFNDDCDKRSVGFDECIKYVGVSKWFKTRFVWVKLKNI